LGNYSALPYRVVLTLLKLSPALSIPLAFPMVPKLLIFNSNVKNIAKKSASEVLKQSIRSKKIDFLRSSDEQVEVYDILHTS